MSCTKQKAADPPLFPTVPTGIDPLVAPPDAGWPKYTHAGAATSLPNSDLGPPLLPVEIAAEKLGLSQRTLWRLIARRQIAVVRIGRVTRLDPDALRRFIRDRTTGPRR